MPFNYASCDEQYEKFPHLIKADVLKLQKWHETQPHLPQISELEAIVFLHACEYDMEKAKIRSDTYYTVRTLCPELFGNRDVFDADITSQMKTLMLAPLPNLTHDGCRVVLCKMIDLDPSNWNYIVSQKLFMMVLDQWLMQSGIANGHIFVVDMEGTTLSHFAKIDLTAMIKFMYYIQDALPVRLRGMHFINTVSFVDKILAMKRPFLKEGLKDAIYVHPTMDTFIDKHVPLAMLPNEYGGAAGNVRTIQETVYKQLQNDAPFFIEEEKTKRVNEKLRPGKPKTARDVFGFDGNFKQLAID